jgi:hypothetical protein
MAKRGSNVRQPSRSRSKVVVADCDGSECFADLRWKNGVASYTFTDGYQDQMEMDRSEFEDWRSDDSLGGYWNSVLRPDTVEEK